jgi:hypothetical protein
MKPLLHVSLWLALLHGHAARADCPLAFAPPEVRRAASEHYYRSSRRDAPAPGRLPLAARPEEGTCARDSALDPESAAACAAINERTVPVGDVAHASNGE